MKKGICLVIALFAITLIISACSDNNQSMNDEGGASTVGSHSVVDRDGDANDNGSENSNMTTTDFINLSLPLIRNNSTFSYAWISNDRWRALYISPAGDLLRYDHYRVSGAEISIIDTDVRSAVARSNPTTIFWIKNDDTLWAQGSNSDGVLGDNTGVDRNEPVHILDNVATFYYSNGSAFAILNDKSLWAWGWGERYQLGTGDAENRYAPTRIMDNVVKVYAQEIFTLALLSDGSLYAWGSYSTASGLPSVYDAQPRRIFNGVKNIFPLAGNDLNNEFIASGSFALITGDNKMYTWSMPRTMQQVNNPESPVPYMPDWDITHIRIIRQGSNVNQFFITADGVLWGMGDNANGELGDGTRIRRNEPVEIKDNAVAIIPIISSWEPSTPIVILNDGSLWHWVFDGYFTPQRALGNVRNHAISHGGANFFITADGSVYHHTMSRLFDETVAIPNYLIRNLSE